MGAQLKNDMQTYMNYHQAKQPSQVRELSLPDNESIKSGRNTLLNSRIKPLKNIFDSEYVRPDQNPRVLKDSDVKKSAALDEALKRYEDSLKKDMATNEKQNEFISQRIISAQGDRSNQKDRKKQVQSHYKESILKQMAEKSLEKQRYKEEVK